MRPAKPQLTRDNARLRRGAHVEQQQAEVAHQTDARASLPKSFTRLSVKRVTPLRSSARQAANFLSSSSAVGAKSAWRGARQHFRQRGGVAQAEVEPLPRHRMQRLRGIADEHHAPGHGLVGARQRQVDRYCGVPMRVHRPARQPNALSSSAAKAASSSAMSSAARSGLTAHTTA